MKVLLLGGVQGNTGPSNVHKALVEAWPKTSSIDTLESSSKVLKLVESLCKGIKSDVVIYPGSGWTEIIAHRFLAMLGKPVVCFNHGYVPFENEVNHLGLSERAVKAIKKHLATADAIVTNSGLQERFVLSKQPELTGKVSHATLGVEHFGFANDGSSRMNIIAVSGGTRPIKANEIVAQAVEILHSRGVDCRLRVYGRRYSANEKLDNAVASGIAEYRGQVSGDVFREQLQECSVFVMDSLHEPFGLSALDALGAGCSLLLSQNCGVAEVMSMTSDDIVFNCEDAVEVADKIEHLFDCPNSRRLYDSIDFDKTSWSRTANKLNDVCLGVLDDRRK